MNGMQVFNFEQMNVRTIVIDEEFFFVAKDAAEILGYSNPLKAIRDHVTDAEKRTERIVHPLGGRQETILINESGLYALIFKSQLKTAARFRLWVTSEVLPALRKTGQYQVPSTMEDMMIATLQEQKKIKSDVDYLKESMRISGAQEYQLKETGSHRAIKCMGGYRSPAYEEVSRKVYGRLWSDFKKYFKLPRYSELPKARFDDAIHFISSWLPDTETRLLIEELNANGEVSYARP